jgi:hypothetical protein
MSPSTFRPGAQSPELFGRRDVSVSLERANLLALPLALLPLLATLLPFLLLWGGRMLLAGGKALMTWYVLLPALIGGVVLHEVIHGLSWACLGRKSLRSIRFGIQWKTLTPFAHCTEPMSARAYRLGAVMPGLLLGAIPAAIGIAIGDGAWTIYGAIFLVAAIGDVMVVWIIRRVPGGVAVADHPARAGCYVFDVPPDGGSGLPDTGREPHAS